MTTTPAAVTHAQTPKKRYEPPRLDIYGDIHKVTQTVSNTGTVDGGHGSMSRTG
jgi:hypothetical protein